MVRSSALLPSAVAIAGTLMLSACGGMSSIVTDVKLQTYSDTNLDAHVKVSAIFNMGQLTFPALRLPVIDPRQPGTEYGAIELRPTLNGLNEIGLDVNVSKLARSPVDADGHLLPNGREIPVAGLQSVIGLRVAGNSRVYLGFSGSQKVLGFAIAIKEFDQIARYVPGANLFLAFNMSKEPPIKGVAGIFTGAQSATSGVGFFVDASALEIPNPAESSNMTMALSARAAAPASRMRLLEQRPADKDDEAEVQRRLYDMSKKRRQLSLE